MHLISMEQSLLPIFFLALLSLSIFLKSSTAGDTITTSRPVKHPETIVSAGGIFELGFFSPKNNSNYHLGIWYKEVSPRRVVWVANRDYAMLNSSSLSIISDGNIVILDGRLSYSVTNISGGNNDSTARLLDTGNLILGGNNLEVLWQSFDDPTDTLLPGMKLGHDPESEKTWSLLSWRGVDDPAPGDFRLELNAGQLIIKQDSKIYWEGSRQHFSLQNVSLRREWPEYAVFSEINTSRISHILLDESGQLKLQSWTPGAQRWFSDYSSKCGYDGGCGAFSICNESADKPCSCLPGFESEQGSWTQESMEGMLAAKRCKRKTKLQCRDNSLSEKDGFKKISNVEFPSNAKTLDFRSAEECRSASLGNCSWNAYAFDERGCLVWDDFYNLTKHLDDNNNGRNFYVKLAASELIAKDKNSSNGSPGPKINKETKRKLWITFALIIPLIMVFLLVILYLRCKFKKKGKTFPKHDSSSEMPELP
ncbi:hypothetical protein Pint_04395 [Pistacia integerrima]|uniref:Uncharacterized protein n=1 Tax=Pistacia integerrima TaxID=434235 RepID=A0ACC0Z592_9ROSI|nr:hypothetical protein Pint_04395 [Pistacia integerrima]